MIDALLDALERGALVVAANNRLARHLHLKFGEAQIAAGRRAWRSPAIIPWKAWIRDLWKESLLNSGQAGQLDLLQEQQARQLWLEIIAASDRVGPFSDINGLAEGAARAWQLMHDWGIELAEIKSGAITTDHRAFVEWARAYRSQCEEAHWVEEAALPGLLELDLDSGKLPIVSAVWFHGFDAWIPSQQRFRLALERTGVVTKIPKDFESFGIGHRTVCADPDNEIESAARWARARFEACPDSFVAVIVPDLAARAAKVRRIFRDVFDPDWRVSSADQSTPVNFSYGTDIASVGVVMQALLAFELTKTKVNYQEVGQLLRSPYFRGGVRESSERAAIEMELRELADPDVELSAVAALSSAQAPEFAALIKAGIMARDHPDIQSPNEWCHWITAFLKAVGWPGDRVLTSTEFQAVAAWNDLLKNFADCEKIVDRIDFRRALGMLTRMSSKRLFQPEGAQRAVQVMGLLEAAGQHFDHLWISGMAGEDWPRVNRPNAFLPLDLQCQYQLPDSSPEQAHAFAAAIIRRRLASAEELVVSWPEQRDSVPLSPSRLIADLPVAELGSLGLHSAPLFNDQIRAMAELVLLKSDLPPAVPAHAQPGGGAAMLGQQSVCPARAFLERRLGAKEIRIPQFGIDPRTRGKLAHWVLNEFFGRISSRAALVDLTPVKLNSILDKLLERGAQRCFGRRRGTMAKLVELEILRLKPILINFLALEARREDFTVVHTEIDQKVKLGGLVLRLRLDRVDRLANGSLLVIDYKTGRNNLSGWSAERPSDPQMPAYAVASGAGVLGLARLNAWDRGYIGVGEENTGIEGILTPAKLTRRAIDDWPALVDAWQAGLEALTREFMGGDFRVDRFRLEPIRGQFSVLSRVNELDQLGLVFVSR